MKTKYKQKKETYLLRCMVILAIMIILSLIIHIFQKLSDKDFPEKNEFEKIHDEHIDELLLEYMNHISNQEYEEMYSMIDIEASGNINKEEFIKRNSAIYEGIEVQNMVITIIDYGAEAVETVRDQGIVLSKEAGDIEEIVGVTYQSSFDTVAGNITFEHEAFFSNGEEGYALIWTDSMIFPELSSTDKVRVTSTQAKRGNILDRNGKTLAGMGTAVSVGVVPGKLENQDGAVLLLSDLLEIEPEQIEHVLSAEWVKEDSFVPIKTIPKVDELQLLSANPSEEVIQEKKRRELLMAIPGVMMVDTDIREYPFGEAAAHLIGYVQAVTAEDLETHAGEGYAVDSVIGRSGIEGLYEQELKGQNGYRIYIVNSEGKEKKELASIAIKNGQNIQLTIDATLQKSIYEQFQEEKGCTVAMNPFTGEVLALVSTPAYNNNDFILGLSNEQWTAISEDEAKPMYNRFRQVWCPGSTLKPIIAAIGLESGAIDSNKDYGNEGLSWQNHSSWGSYYVTTMHSYEPANLSNALMYSDNIYFAKAALRIGDEKMEQSLLKLGFSKELPFEIIMQPSQYSNTEHIETEIQLADSGYGQGQVLVNPLHMACMYSAFCNGGNMIAPYLIYRRETTGDYWITEVCSNEAADMVLDGMRRVINDPNGTGYAVHMDDVVLAGKTGTAEIKASKEDTSGNDLGWFAVFTPENNTEKSIMLISMVEDVKGRGGSNYVVERDQKILDEWFHSN